MTASEPNGDWLTARPIAHRGLHDRSRGIIENTPGAITAAVAGGYGIEVDVQLSADGEAMVHHDEALGRLTEGDAPLATLGAAALKQVPFRETADRMITLGELCDLVAGRATLVVEIKSLWDGDERLARRTATVLSGYRGPVAAMSFDPRLVAAVRRHAPGLRRGLVAERGVEDRPGSALRYLQNLLAAGPQFLAYSVQDLGDAVTFTTRRLLRRPVLTWTVRTPEDRLRAGRLADQMIFEGFIP
ncbi:MAG TPA: glycerophosphodiester phosphodiesterase family protein [Xanthobacteraceae bacterium]|nr:glycerophosphodiester phosphodiesterase family protein [Xanthobacteraceae bacterium]